MQLVEKCSPFARIAVTGSGLVALLNSFRTARVNGFALWDAVRYVGLGSAPSLPTSEAMAARLLEPYAVAWPQPARDFLAPKVLVDTFVPSTHAELTSARPALMAYALSCMGDATTGTAADVLGDSEGAVLCKLKAESIRDTLSALVSMAHVERRVLRDVAAGLYSCAELTAVRKGKGAVHFKNKGQDLDGKGVVVSAQPEKLAALIGCLRETSFSEKDSDAVRLQPPYAALLNSWIRRNGMLAVSVGDDKIDLDAATRSNLVLIFEERGAVASAGLWDKATAAFWTSVLSNGIGFRDVSKSTSGDIKIDLRAPVSPEEFSEVPALARLNDLLSAKFLTAVEQKQQETDKEKQKRIHVPSKPTLYKMLRDAVAADVGGSVEGASFQERLGVELIFAFRHFHAHIWDDTPALVRNGLTAAVVAEAVGAVVAVLAAGDSGYFALDPAKPEQLTTRQRLTQKI